MQDTQEMWVRSLSREDPQRRAWEPIPVILFRKSHEQSSLVVFSPGSFKQLDIAEQTHIMLSVEIQFVSDLR